MRTPLIPAALAVACLLVGAPASAQPICTVPGTHATIQAAVDNVACTTIQLANQTYSESVNIPRTLDLVGPAAGTAVIQGLLRVVGAGTLVDVLDSVRVENSCAYAGVRAEVGGQMTGEAFEAVRGVAFPCPLNAVFSDGFESGNTTNWDQVVN
jgi:hypothetical protein